MASESSVPMLPRLASRLMVVAVAMLAAAAVVLLAAVLLPINTPTVPALSNRRDFVTVPDKRRDLARLLDQTAGAELIKPAQIQAAVKDTGVAARLVRQLTLKGVVQIGGELVAYIEVKDQGVKSVKKGQKILEFAVKDMESGKVVLTLDGVEVQLGQ